MADLTQWEGCYDNGWTGLIVPEAFSHPAKFSRSLIHRIYQHAKEMGWVHPGDYVLDPFGGVGLGALDAITMGLNWCGCELEQKFAELAQKNFLKWNLDLRGWPNLGTARMINGDSRNIKAVIEKADLVVSSPPFTGITPTAGDPNYDWKFHGDQSNYGHTPGNLANMKEGDIDLVVGSPPYAGSMESDKGGIDWEKAGRLDRTKPSGKRHSVMSNNDPTSYGQSPGQLGSLKEGDFDSVIGKFDPELIKFFWGNVIKGDCWEWIGNLHNAGYGQFRFKGKRYFAHRLSWEIHFGPIPKNLLVCHQCDNPKCGKARMVPKEGDELGIEAIRNRLEVDDQVIRTLMKLEGVPKVYLRNSIPVTSADETVDRYEITPAYSYEFKNGKVSVIEKPWAVKDDDGVDSNSLLPAPVVVSMIRQITQVLEL